MKVGFICDAREKPTQTRLLVYRTRPNTYAAPARVCGQRRCEHNGRLPGPEIAHSQDHVSVVTISQRAFSEGGSAVIACGSHRFRAGKSFKEGQALLVMVSHLRISHGAWSPNRSSRPGNAHILTSRVTISELIPLICGSLFALR